MNTFITLPIQRTRYYKRPAHVLSEPHSLVEHARHKLLYHELAPLYELAIGRDTQREVVFLHDAIGVYCSRAVSILDLGCGVGRHAGILQQQYGYQVTGVDLSDAMLEVARRTRPLCKFVHGDIRQLRFPAGTFDVAVCMWTTFNYLSRPQDITGFFEGAHSAIRAGGILIIDCKNYCQAEKQRSYVRSGDVANIEMALRIRKEFRSGVNHAVYSYVFRDRESGRSTRLVDQELAKVYSRVELASLGEPLFSEAACFGDYEITNLFRATWSDRILMILRRRDDGRL